MPTHSPTKPEGEKKPEEPKRKTTTPIRNTNNSPEFAIVPLAVLSGLISAILLVNIFPQLRGEPDQGGFQGRVVVSAIGTPTPTPVPEYEEEIEREIIESINYRRQIVTLPEVHLYGGLTFWARSFLERSENELGPKFSEIPDSCETVCTFEQEVYNVWVVALDIRAMKNQVVEETLDTVVQNIQSRGVVFDCANSIIGVAVKKLHVSRYFVIVTFFNGEEKC